eukprot:3014905-Prymnesium_polylepis.1
MDVRALVLRAWRRLVRGGHALLEACLAAILGNQVGERKRNKGVGVRSRHRRRRCLWRFRETTAAGRHAVRNLNRECVDRAIVPGCHAAHRRRCGCSNGAGLEDGRAVHADFRCVRVTSSPIATGGETGGSDGGGGGGWHLCCTSRPHGLYSGVDSRRRPDVALPKSVPLPKSPASPLPASGTAGGEGERVVAPMT